MLDLFDENVIFDLYDNKTLVLTYIRISINLVFDKGFRTNAALTLFDKVDPDELRGDIIYFFEDHVLILIKEQYFVVDLQFINKNLHDL